jgi:hypothetical protein
MFDSTTLSFIFEQLLTELPSIIVLTGGIVFAFIFWQRAPAASLYVVLACGLTLLLLLLYPVAWQVAHYLFDYGDATKARRVNIAMAVLWSIARAIATGLLLFAVYTGRKRE